MTSDDFEIEKSLERALISKNWSNILLRNDVRVEMTKGRRKQLDERRLVEYLNQMSDEQLGKLRERVFKLAQDHYFECLLKKFASTRPYLKDSVGKPQQARDENARLSEIRDLIECIEFILDIKERIPVRCTEFIGSSGNSGFDFPLGRKNLMAQLNAIKTLRFKILRLQTELFNFKKLTNGMEKMENNLATTCLRLRQVQKQNSFLKALLTFFLIIFITCSISFLFFNCLKNSTS